MIHVIGTIRVRAGVLDSGPPAAMAAMVAATRAEDGCIAYSYARDVFDPTLVHVVERWRDRDALDAHFVQRTWRNGGRRGPNLVSAIAR